MEGQVSLFKGFGRAFFVHDRDKGGKGKVLLEEMKADLRWSFPSWDQEKLVQVGNVD